MTGERISREQAAAIFRRAAAIEADRDSVDVDVDPAATLDMATVEQAALEAGLSRQAVRQAAVEVRGGAGDPRRSARLVGIGDRAEVVTRVVDGPPEQVRTALARWLEGQRLRVRRRTGDHTIWEKATGLAATVARAVDLNHQLRLGQVSEVTADVVDAGDGRAFVRVEVDFRELRNSYLGGLGATTGLSSAAAAAMAGGFSGTWGALAGGALGLTGAGVGSFLGFRGSFRNKKGSAVDAIEGFLDELEAREARPNRSPDRGRRR